MPKRRSLADLYTVGKMVTIGDDGDELPVTVYIRKLSPMETEKALRRANAKRAQIAFALKDKDSEEYQDAYSQAMDMDRSALVEFVLSDELNNIRLSVEAELEAEDEWAEDGYAQGLYDAWNTGLSEVYANDPENEDALRVLNEMQRLQDQVQTEIDARVEVVRRGWAAKTDEKLWEAATTALIKFASDTEWMREYRKSQVWLAVRDPEDTRSYYFETREELDDLALEVMGRLMEEYLGLEVDSIEGKDSVETPDSSNS